MKNLRTFNPAGGRAFACMALAAASAATAFAPAAQAQTQRGLIVRVQADPGWAFRVPYRPDLIVRQGSGRFCETTFEQTMTPEGLVWRPLIMCPIED
jgi:hypothetical protein